MKAPKDNQPGTDPLGFAISRRQFVGTIGAVAGALNAPGLALAAGKQQEILTASHWGMVRAIVQDGRLVRVEPFEKDPHPTKMLKAFHDRVYSSSRIAHPMVRKGFLDPATRHDTSRRGADAFVRVSWDQALDLVAGELKRVKEKYGNSALFPGSADWQSAGLLHSASTLTRRMLGLYGGFTDCSGDPSIAAAMVILPHVLGELEVYGQQTAWPAILDNAKNVVLWGCCILKDDQIGTHPADHAAYPAMEQLRAKVARKEIKVISIDPRITDTAQYVQADWVAPRPNTDTALMLALMHVLYTEKRYDADFIQKYCYGFDQFLPYLLGTPDGLPKTPEWAQHITGIPAAKITQLARTLASGRTMLITGYAIQRADHGEQPYWALVALGAMLGHIGLPGGGLGFSYHYDNGGSLSARAPGIVGIPAGSNAIEAALPFERVTDMLLHPGQTVNYNGETIKYPDVKMIYWAGGNPLTHLWQTSKVIEAWRRPETIVVADPFWTPTARFADIVLPATTTFERNDLEVCGAYSQKYIVGMHQAIAPVGESRNDYDIMAGLAKRLGFEDQFTEKKSEIDWLREFYDRARTASKAMGTALPDFDAFWKGKGYVEFPLEPGADTYTKHVEFRQDPQNNPLGTPSGKIEIYSKTIAAFNYSDCPGHPTWLEPIEWLGSELAKQYPLHVVSPHPQFRLHSQLDNTILRKAYEVADREPVWISEVDAKKRKIASGDVVRLYNGRGSVLAGAVVTNRIRPGVIMLQEGAWYDPDKPGDPSAQCKHGLINVLTINKGTSQLAQGNIANTCLVEVERYAKTPPAVTAFTAPA
ncbi:trimethylamine-N-oxide reductase TorA [Castellaniella caeni]|uniref:trimethylamine-N-oxide reductase TorA n=1 Tax=Castellaniella caeni TaxID=266123 RepID=UPI0008320313|nr:trimethylamine-N-oxide reductase TorA [Castellaniella caeni]